MQTLQITVAIDDEGKLLLPPGCKIVGDVHLQVVGIRLLPENLSIGGYLDLEGTPITPLPTPSRWAAIWI
jgi:hypothetical protein